MDGGCGRVCCSVLTQRIPGQPSTPSIEAVFGSPRATPVDSPRSPLPTPTTATATPAPAATATAGAPVSVTTDFLLACGNVLAQCLHHSDMHVYMAATKAIDALHLRGQVELRVPLLVLTEALRHLIATASRPSPSYWIDSDSIH